MAEPAFLVVADVAAIVAAIALGGRLTTNTVGVVALCAAVLAAGGLYGPRLARSALDDAPSIAGRLLVAAAVTALARQAVGGSLMPIDRARVLGVMVVAVVASRTLGYACLRWMRQRPGGCRRAIVVGAGEVGAMLVAALCGDRRFGVEPVAVVDPEPLDEACDTVPVVRSDALGETITEVGAELVIVAFSSLAEPHVVDLVRTCDRARVEIYVVPRLFELATQSSEIEDVRGIPLIRLRRLARRSRRWACKRVMDVTLASGALAVALPWLLLAAVVLRRETGGPALFRQERVGLDGRPFTLYKLCTYVPAAPDEAATRWSVAGSDEIGPIGRFLRATSLDELPQLWNVIRGDMSLVGPRPERPFFVQQYTAAYPHYRSRHRVPSGLTGLAQVNGLRGDTSIDERARYDNAYIERWSLWADVKILLRTAISLAGRRGS
ncbi:MAG: sugar transferase [Acidimicrobiia bacterium]|nr:sugar transferase [Acidimicrobiia bacterium]